MAQGKEIADAQCVDCHEVADWDGETTQSLASKINAIAQGKVKHKTKIKLSDEQMRAVAAYWAGGK